MWQRVQHGYVGRLRRTLVWKRRPSAGCFYGEEEWSQSNALLLDTGVVRRSKDPITPSSTQAVVALQLQTSQALFE